MVPIDTMMADILASMDEGDDILITPMESEDGPAWGITVTTRGLMEVYTAESLSGAITVAYVSLCSSGVMN